MTVVNLTEAEAAALQGVADSALDTLKDDADGLYQLGMSEEEADALDRAHAKLLAARPGMPQWAVVEFPDAEAMDAARISSIKVVGQAAPLAHELQVAFPLTAEGEPAGAPVCLDPVAERDAELRGALAVLAGRFAEEEAANAGTDSSPVAITYGHAGLKITVERRT